MSNKMQFQVFYGDYNILYEPNGVDLSVARGGATGPPVTRWGVPPPPSPAPR